MLSFGGRIAAIFNQKRIDAETLSELEDLLIEADMSAKTAHGIIDLLGKNRIGKEAGAEEIKSELAKIITGILQPLAKKLVIDKSLHPHVILLAGVNGSGKTTTIGKIAHRLKSEGLKVMLAGCDTFRAAAVNQLAIWAERTGSMFISGAENSDPAAIAYQALARARKESYDVLLIDTAGRLQNKSALMEELGKIIRVLKKIEPLAPHHSLLVLDATIGQNAIAQGEIFKATADINGLIVNKLDGTAKGGIIVALAQKFALPVYAVGSGEGINDLQDFDAEIFAKNLVGL